MNQGQPPDGQEHPRGHGAQQAEKEAAAKGTRTVTSAIIFAVAAVATLIAGVVLERSGDAIAGHIGVSGVLFGATILAAATSLPEVSTGLTSVKHAEFQLAVSDIFGDNTFLPALFLLTTLISGKSVLPQVAATDIYLDRHRHAPQPRHAAGLLFRPQRRMARMGRDSLVVAVPTSSASRDSSPSLTADRYSRRSRASQLGARLPCLRGHQDRD